MHIATRGRVLAAVALAAVVLTAVTGCSSDPGQDDSEPELLRGLAILADSNSANQVTYLNVVHAQKLSKEDKERFGVIGLPGTSLWTGYEPGPWGQSLEVTQIDTAVDSMKAGRWKGSFDATAITKSLKSNGYAQSEKDGKQIWTGPDDPEVSFQVSNDEISYSRGATPMSAVNPEKGASLADKKEYQRAAECLGDVYRADFSPLTTTKPVRLSALGQHATSVSKNTEVLCFVAKDDATAKRLAVKLRSVVREESPRFDGAKVTVENGERPLVRAVVPDTATQHPGRLMISDVDLWMVSHDL